MSMRPGTDTGGKANRKCFSNVLLVGLLVWYLLLFAY